MPLKVLAVSKAFGTTRLFTKDRLSVTAVDVVSNVAFGFESLVAIWAFMLLVAVVCAC